MCALVRRLLFPVVFVLRTYCKLACASTWLSLPMLWCARISNMRHVLHACCLL